MELFCLNCSSCFSFMLEWFCPFDFDNTVINSEASSKEIGNVLTVFYYGRLALVSMTTTIQLLLILRLNMSFQAMERVDVEQKMSIRFLHWFLNFTTLRLNSPCRGWHKLHILPHCHTDNFQVFLNLSMFWFLFALFYCYESLIPASLTTMLM